MFGKRELFSSCYDSDEVKEGGARDDTVRVGGFGVTRLPDVLGTAVTCGAEASDAATTTAHNFG